MINRIEYAKALIEAMYPSCRYKDIRMSCRRWGHSHYDGGEIHAGMFRSVIIPDGMDFVIKVGACKGGADQCRREYALYDEAKKLGIGKYFATMYGKFTYHRHEFYIMEKVTPNDDDDLSFYTLARKKSKKLDQFIDDNDINDIHSENFGFDKKHQVKVFDYGGYHFGDNDDEVDDNWDAVD